MGTTQYVLLEIITGNDHENVMVRNLIKRELIDGKVKSFTIPKSNLERGISHIRMKIFLSKEYILTPQQFRSFLEMKDLFQIDVSNLGNLTA